jgi:hypothetical protein
VIVASTTAGTTMADFATRSLGIGYTGGSLLLFACLIAVLMDSRYRRPRVPGWSACICRRVSGACYHLLLDRRFAGPAVLGRVHSNSATGRYSGGFPRQASRPWRAGVKPSTCLRAHCGLDDSVCPRAALKGRQPIRGHPSRPRGELKPAHPYFG